MIDLEDISSDNRPLSGDEAKVVTENLRQLEETYSSTSGHPHVSEVAGPGTVPQEDSAIQALADSIRLHRWVLSSFRFFPTEVLQIIFVFVCFEMKDDWDEGPSKEVSHCSIDLATLCQVSRPWRDAALTHCVLWTHPPKLVIGYRDLPTSEAGIRLMKVFSGPFKHYVARSGALPLDFSFNCWIGSRLELQAARDQQSGMLTEIMTYLVDNCHRWGYAYLQLPAEALVFLSPIRGNIPLLRRLRIEIGKPIPLPTNNIPPTIDYFAKAPALRILKVMMKSYRIPTHFPITQLEDVALWWDAAGGGDPPWKTILESQSPALHKITVHMREELGVYLSYAPTVSCTLANLRELVFQNNNYARKGDAPVPHLAMLTLPALTRLELPQTFGNAPGSLYTEVLNLIRRSRCDIRELRLGYPLPVSTTEPHSETVFEILSLCPSLTKVELGHTDTKALQRLVLNDSADDERLRLLPHLETLYITHQRTGAAIDVPTLMQVVTSRRILGPPRRTQINDLSTPAALGCVVRLTGYSAVALQVGMDKWEADYVLLDGSPAMSSSPLGLRSLGQDICERLNDWAFDLDAYSKPCSGHHTKRIHTNIGRIAEALEGLQLDEFYSPFILRKGIPAMMHTSALRQSGSCDLCPPSQRSQELDVRLGSLLARWKPFLLRETRSGPWRWRYDVTGAERRWTLRSYLWYQPLDELDDDELWRRIITCEKLPPV